MSKLKDFLKAFFSGGSIAWNKEEGWHTKSKDEVASDFYGNEPGSNTMLDNIINKYTGAGLTDADREANQFTADQALLQREWSSQEAERARDWNEEMYAKYNSLSGKIAQAEQSGVNPMFAVTDSAVSPVSAGASAPSGSSASSVRPTSHGLTDLFGSIIGLMKAKAEIDNINADTAQKTKQTSWIDQINELNLDKVRSEIKSNEGAYDKAMQDIKESVSRISVNDSTIEINGARISLMGSQEELNATKSAVEKLNAETAQKLMPYIQARQEAEIAYTTAKTEEARNSAEKQMYDANLSMLGVMREADLIDKGYYDNLVSQSEWEARGSKRNYKWKPINDVCSNLSKIAVGAGSFMSGLASLQGVPSPAPAPVSPANLSFF